MNQEIRARKRTEMDGEIDPEKEEVPVPVAPAYAHNKKWFLYNIYFNAILYSSCFWVQIGVMPYLSKKLGADPVVFGYLQTTFALVQLCGGPIIGRFGDIFGSRAALVLSFAAAALTYSILGLASSVTMLFVSRLPSVFMHAMQGSQMIVTDISGKDERADALGKLGVFYAVGMVIGPSTGGLITHKYGERTAAFLSAFVSCVSIVIAYVFIPGNTKSTSKEMVTSDSSKQSESSPQKENIFSVKKFTELLQIPAVFFLITVKIITGIPFGIFQSMFSLVSMEYFKLEPQQNGFVMSYVGGLSIVVQGFLVGRLSKRFSEAVLLKSSICVIALAYGLLYLVTNIYQFCIVIIPMVVGGTTLNVITTSAITKSVLVKDTGAVLGLSMATNSLIRTVSPTLGSIMYKHYGWPSFGLLGFVVNTIVAAYLFISAKHTF